jgi:predicted amidohydrolase YtcJ
MLDRDLTRIAPETIAETRVMLTMVGGRIVYERPGR